MLHRILQLRDGTPNLDVEEHPPKTTLARVGQQRWKQHVKEQRFEGDEAIGTAKQECLSVQDEEILRKEFLT
ncbi:hypothetical protein EVAR_15115_1 [Eumeta japonica]|uniref:Uncharacterized protein n=1 Tax=Eumeta variegata TaxID=151549 RepID=A0A4C1UJF1_EUMVA|nr:hypothetical protein EVAR_15115_1 [Eumeta japonica]